MIKVYLVDDHELVRSGIERLLADTRDIRVRATASNAAEARRRFAMATFPFDVVLLDISLPDANGLDLIQPLRARGAGAPPVLVLSIHPGDPYALRALRKGAAGYFAKDGSAADLAGAIRTVASGGRYLTTEIAELVADEVVSRGSRTGLPGLSDREFEVLRRIALGQRSKDIAAALSLNAKTVATFKARICRKTGLVGTADIVRYAMEQRLELGTL
jgi:two-component system, NarL family, invasion response regulator UvrY